MSQKAAKDDNLKSVRELIAERPEIDNSAVFEQLRGIQDSLWNKITDRFSDLRLDPSTSKLQPYHSLDNEAHGNLAGYVGSDVDWGVCSWVGNPARSFCNLHITVWMRPEHRIPHLAMACGTFPVFFFLLDYIPRVEPTVYPEYMQKYLEPANKRYLELNDDERFMPFISQSVFVRSAVSSIGYNFISQPGTVGSVEKFDELSHEFFDRWLKWSQEEDRFDEGIRDDVAKRDLAIRKNTAELDPANVVVEKMYGEDLTRQLVRGLWGGDRELD